jgi:tetratricopeptide (TPR) repeat protein
MATRVHPDAHVFWEQGNIEWHFKHPNKAIEAYTEAIRIQPDYEDAYYGRGNMYLEKGEYDNAIVDFEALLKINPLNTEGAKRLEEAKAKSPQAIAAKAAAEQKEKEARAAKDAAEQKEKEAFRQSYKESTGKDINLSDVVKDNNKWAYVEDVKEAFRQEYNKTHGKDISLSDVVWDYNRAAYIEDVNARIAKEKQKGIIYGIIGGILGGIAGFIGGAIVGLLLYFIFGNIGNLIGQIIGSIGGIIIGASIGKDMA